METHHATLNRQARLAMRQRLRTTSEFDAWLYDHFPSLSPLIPENVDQVHKETILIRCVGAESIISALPKAEHDSIRHREQYGKKQFIALLVIVSIAVAIVLYYNNMPPQVQPGDNEYYTSSITGGIKAISAQSDMMYDNLVSGNEQNQSIPDTGKPFQMPKSSQTNTHWGNRTIAPGVQCPMQLIPANHIGNGIYVFGKGATAALLQAGMRLNLYWLSSHRSNNLAFLGTGITIEPDDNVLARFIIEHKTAGKLPAQLCISKPIAGRSRNIIGQVVSMNPIRINIGSGAGVQVGDIYLILGDAVIDHSAQGSSLGRDINGSLRIVSVEVLFSRAELLDGRIEQGDYVKINPATLQGQKQ